MQKAWQAPTLVDFGQASPGQHVGPGWRGDRDGGLRGRGVLCNSGGRFSAVEAAGGCKAVAGAYES